METSTDLVCSICGERISRGDGWFLLSEDRWLDRLKVLHWNEILARQPGMHSLCGAPHVRELVAHWMTTGSLDYPFACAPAEKRPQPRKSPRQPVEEQHTEVASGQLIGELAVHRESLERVLCENPRSLSSVLEALLGALDSEPSGAPLPCDGEFVLV